jgi:HD-GYP domain-containing protein (c-di-GMP phosphodiesterase class II)
MVQMDTGTDHHSGGTTTDESARLITSLLVRLRAHDSVAAAQAEHAAELAVRLAERLRLDTREIAEVRDVALLHDVGNLGVPRSTLVKAAPLTAEEWGVIRAHSEIGADLVAAASSLAGLAPLVRGVHERWDGDGYPDGLAGEDIPLVSRIVSVCDAFSALTWQRPFRNARPNWAALEIIDANAGTQFCPLCAGAFVRLMRADGIV